MGRRSALKNILEPMEGSLAEIVAASDSRGMRFTEIVRQAEGLGISRATVSRYLPKLVKKGLIKKEDLGNKRISYKLAMEAVQGKQVQRSLFSILSMHLFNRILEGASAGKLSDEEFTKLFTGRVGALAMYTLLTSLSMADKDPDQAGKWMEEAFGTLIQKDGWRICLNRQIFGKPVPLRRQITLKTPVTPEIVIEEGTIYVKLPESIEPGLSARVLKELPPIPKRRLEELKSSLNKIYREETEMLDQTLSNIQEAANVSARR